MWNSKRYKEILGRIKDTGELNGVTVSTKDEIYAMMVENLHISYDSAKGWARPNSNGPSDENVKKNIEVFLGVSEGYFDKKEECEVKEMKNYQITDFNKNAILKCYQSMKIYLRDDKVEAEERFAEMCNDIEREKIAIPIEIYQKIQEYVDTNLAPIVYDPVKTFEGFYSDELYEIDEQGRKKLKNEECTKKACMAFMEKLIEIEEGIDRFAMKELHPYLV